MAIATNVVDNLNSFVSATDSATQNLPDPGSLALPDNGITLLDAKSEILLSYLQALALRNLNVIRSIKNGSDVESARKISNDITERLVEHRVYLERGVRPLEQKIKYQVDRVVKAADDDEKTALQTRRTTESNSRKTAESSRSKEDSDNEDDSDISDELNMDAESFKPNPKMMDMGSTEERNPREASSAEDGIYRPPRISATTMPEIDRRERAERKPTRSRTLDEYVATELSTAPLAEPSIGSNIALGGRRNKSARQLAEERERQEYEETNLVRLPKQSKQELANKGLRGRDTNGSYGGEDWRDIGDSLDRIGDLTRNKNKGSALDRSRKRRAVEDSPRDSGMGSAFDMKKRRVMKQRR